MAAEMLLQYLWENRLWQQCDLSTTDGRPIRVIDQGRRNTDAGPDFFNAKIIIDGKLWAGNVEIHTRASDWRRHNHHLDPAYDTIILHVVGHSDEIIYRRNGAPIPQMVLPYTPDYRARYEQMVNNPARLPCGESIHDFSAIYLTDWLTALGYERIYSKVERVMGLLQRLNGDWQQTAYVTVARALGFSTNSDPFERLALATPLRLLLKHSNDPQLVEALLYGQAGFLDNLHFDDPEEQEYVDRLRADHSFLATKYNLPKPENLGWKMARMRPQNFPHRRIAALVAMLVQGFPLGRHIARITNEAAAREPFEVQIGGYWVNHFTFGNKSAYAPRALSHDSVTSLLINAIAPLLVAYGTYFGDESRLDTAVALLQGLPAEKNSIVSIFTDAGIPCPDAFTSQALIQLRRNYCEQRKCLYCRIGHRILAAKAHP